MNCEPHWLGIGGGGVHRKRPSRAHLNKNNGVLQMGKMGCDKWGKWMGQNSP